MKKIALLTDGWKRYLMYSWVDGIMGTAKKWGEEIGLFHYNCYGNWSHDTRYNQGEYNIFNLPDLRTFDGVIVDGNNIKEERQLQHLIALARECGVPVVSINYDIEDFYYVGINNTNPIRDMMEHLYEKHGCRSFIYAGGPKGNHENEIRVDTFLECLRKYGLRAEDNPVWYRDYDFDTGIYYMQKIAEEGVKIPDAIICANDNIATGLCTEAERRGYKIPEDFLVTGFDNLDKALYFQPQITTVNHHRGEIGGKCLDVLCRVWKGEKLEKYHLIDTEIVISESCGCPNNKAVDYRSYMKGQITYGVEKEKKEVSLVDLEADMSLCSGFFELFGVASEFLKKCECSGFYVVIDEDLLNAGSNADFAVEGYRKDKMALAYAEDFQYEVEFCSIAEMELYMQTYGEGCHYLHTPIHFGEQTVGYTILRDATFLYYDSAYFYSMHSIMMKEMEKLYRRRQIENVNRKLRDVYNKDQLTGLFNRIAYNERMEPEFEEYRKKKITCAIIFIDVNKFKMINDTYGHKYGDEVLKKVASLIRNHCSINGYCYRYGGDEFVMFLPYMDMEGAKMLKNDMKRASEKINVGISIGIAVTNPDDEKSLQAYVEIADKDMYEDKSKGR